MRSLLLASTLAAAAGAMVGRAVPGARARMSPRMMERECPELPEPEQSDRRAAATFALG